VIHERDVGEPRDFMDEHQAEMQHIPITPKTATAKAAGFAYSASVAPSGRCGQTTPRRWGSSPSREHPWRCWSIP
jgi:hypothetical protein